MEKFLELTSKVVPLPKKNIDTDMIIPAQFLTSVSREGYGKNLFRRLRDQDINFPLNKPEYANAKILCADENFACGSSREHAVWALMGAGFRVVISKSFADIFTSNSSKNGLVLIVLPENIVNEILQGASSENYQLRVSLENQKVYLPDGREVQFAFDPFRKHCILNGLDDVDYILSHQAAIQEYRKSREALKFFSSLLPTQKGTSE